MTSLIVVTATIGRLATVSATGAIVTAKAFAAGTATIAGCAAIELLLLYSYYSSFGA